MQFLEWDSANVILIQAFWGPFDDGHFSSLILDRTRKGNPLAVYAYSLREYKPDAGTWYLLFGDVTWLHFNLRL